MVLSHLNQCEVNMRTFTKSFNISLLNIGIIFFDLTYNVLFFCMISFMVIKGISVISLKGSVLEKNINLFFLSSHSSHLCQPMDRGGFIEKSNQSMEI